MLRDTTENVEHMTYAHYLIEADERYPMENFKGQPEFDLFERDTYTVENDDDLPVLTFTSTMQPNELAPLPPEHNYDYQ
jgi:hypothetical protein